MGVRGLSGMGVLPAPVGDIFPAAYDRSWLIDTIINDIIASEVSLTEPKTPEDLALRKSVLSRIHFLPGDFYKTINQLAYSFQGPVRDSQTDRLLQEAVDRASKIAQPGESVLLSPGCSSYDMFRDYAHRGDEFKRIVRELKERKG